MKPSNHLKRVVITLGIVLAVVGVTPAVAQSTESVRVSTLGEDSANPIGIRGGQQYAQDFCTGPTAVTLNKVRLATRTSYEPQATVTVRSDTSGSPGGTVGTLTNPATIDNDISTNEDFTSSGIELDANSRYWLAIHHTGHRTHSLYVDVTRSKDESSAEAGWSVGDKMLFMGIEGWSPAFASSYPAGYRMRVAVYASGDSPATTGPVFPCGYAAPLTMEVDENVASGTAVGQVMATDPDGDAVTHSVSGTDAAAFNQVFSLNASTGAITVKTDASPNYEAKSSYSMTVDATDGEDASGDPESPAVADASVPVLVRVNNIDEPGTITLAPSPPAVGRVLEAELTDPDGEVRIVSVKWHKADAAAGPFTLIGGNNSECSLQGCYTPAAADQDKFLKIAIVYYDGASGPRNSQGQLIISSSDPIRDRRALHATSANAVEVGGL